MIKFIVKAFVFAFVMTAILSLLAWFIVWSAQYVGNLFFLIIVGGGICYIIKHIND